MMVLALAMVPLLVVPLLWHLSGPTNSTVDAVDWFIWAMFVGEYGVKLWLVPARAKFVRTHVLDLIVIAIPLLRPLRVVRAARALRLLRLARVVPLVAIGLRNGRAIFGRQGIRFTALFAIAVIFASAGAEAFFERDAHGSNIHNFGDGLWWAVTTVTTVGYGDKFPVTATGRGVAVVLMLTGIALFGVITASVAAFFIETAKPDGLDELKAQLDRIEAALAERTQS
jgi:voltage-gated potassium channel